jgi:hypothetical protein
MLQEYTLELEKQNSVFSIVDADKIKEINIKIPPIYGNRNQILENRLVR